MHIGHMHNKGIYLMGLCDLLTRDNKGTKLTPVMYAVSTDVLKRIYWCKEDYKENYCKDFKYLFPEEGDQCLKFWNVSRSLQKIFNMSSVVDPYIVKEVMNDAGIEISQKDILMVNKNPIYEDYSESRILKCLSFACTAILNDPTYANTRYLNYHKESLCTRIMPRIIRTRVKDLLRHKKWDHEPVISLLEKVGIKAIFVQEGKLTALCLNIHKWCMLVYIQECVSSECGKNCLHCGDLLALSEKLYELGRRELIEDV